MMGREKEGRGERGKGDGEGEEEGGTSSKVLGGIDAPDGVHRNIYFSVKHIYR